LLSISQKPYPEGTMPRFLVDRRRKHRNGLWMDLEDQASFELSPEAGHLQGHLSVETNDGRAKELRTPYLMHIARYCLHRD